MRPRRLKKHREKTADGGRRRLPDYCRRARAQACRQQTGARVGSHCRHARAPVRTLPARVRKQPRLRERAGAETAPRARARLCGNSPASASAPVRKQPRVRARGFAETGPPARARRCGNSPAGTRAPLRKQPRVRAARLCGRCRKFTRHRKIT
ncbi:UNVERIFIED_CONTAM: hypothetical protein Sindi_2929400 [Sesamum indicum]